MKTKTTSFKFQIESQTFLMELTMDGALQFFIEVPYEKTASFEEDRMWGKWWEEDFDWGPSYSSKNYGIHVNPFAFIKELKNQVKRMIYGNNLNFFYFSANDPRKYKMYMRIYRDLQEEFKDWTVQYVDDYIYFFRPLNKPS